MLQNFNGNLAWIHNREGHNGSPYWPGGASGITLDPGIDLGYVDRSVLQQNYGELMTPDQFSQADQVLGVKGDMARRILGGAKSLKSFNISREEAERIFPVVARDYWKRTTERWPELIDAPPCVQTAMLSLTYNRGPGNKRLSVISYAIATRNWFRLGELIFQMQQKHKLHGIRKRRRLEGVLITNNLKKEMAQGYKGVKRLKPMPIQSILKKFKLKR